MMAATRSKKPGIEKLPENDSINKIERSWRKRQKPLPEKDESRIEEADEELEIPYAKVLPLPSVVRDHRRTEAETKAGYKNKAPLQYDERGVELIKESLKNPVNITTEDLLNISESARQELKKLLTKKRVEKSVVFVAKEDEEHLENMIHAEQLPDVSYEVLQENQQGMPKGSVIVGDPVEQYLGSLQPGEKPKKIVVAPESVGLRAVFPLINDEARIESLLDGGSQIVSMAKDVAEKLKIAWDPGITVHMESANKALEQTLGLAKNVPLKFGHIVIYLQIHIIKSPAYKMLLGRPFDSITESLVKNEKDGSQTLTLTDPNTGERCAMNTYERGDGPENDEIVSQDFQLFSMN